MSISTLTQLAEVETNSPPAYYRELRALIFFQISMHPPAGRRAAYFGETLAKWALCSLYAASCRRPCPELLRAS